MKLQLLTKKSFALIVIACASFTGTALRAADDDETALLAQLKQSKHSLADGVAQAEKENGAGISAKFEMEGETLMLSVYTAKAGPNADAEHNTLIELNGDATKSAWTPGTEVFEDKKHLTRSAMQLTLVQASKVSLSDAINHARSAQAGTVYSVIPAVKDGAPVYQVKVATADGKSVHVTVDGTTGKVTR